MTAGSAAPSLASGLAAAAHSCTLQMSALHGTADTLLDAGSRWVLLCPAPARHSFQAWPRAGPPLPTDMRIKRSADTVSAASSVAAEELEGPGVLHLKI